MFRQHPSPHQGMPRALPGTLPSLRGTLSPLRRLLSSLRGTLSLHREALASLGRLPSSLRWTLSLPREALASLRQTPPPLRPRPRWSRRAPSRPTPTTPSAGASPPATGGSTSVQRGRLRPPVRSGERRRRDAVRVPRDQAHAVTERDAVLGLAHHRARDRAARAVWLPVARRDPPRDGDRRGRGRLHHR